MEDTIIGRVFSFSCYTCALCQNSCFSYTLLTVLLCLLFYMFHLLNTVLIMILKMCSISGIKGNKRKCVRHTHLACMGVIFDDRICVRFVLWLTLVRLGINKYLQLFLCHIWDAYNYDSYFQLLFHLIYQFISWWSHLLLHYPEDCFQRYIELA